MSFLKVLPLVVLACSTPALSEVIQTTEVTEIVKKMTELHASLNGKTVTMKGAIGTLLSDELFFKNEDGQFSVQFDAGRAARKKVEGCELEWFDWAKSKCLFEVDAEIVVDEPFSFADGGKIKLIVYDIRD